MPPALILSIVLLLHAAPSSAADDGLGAYREAFGAYFRKDYPAYRDAMRRTVAARPEDANAMYSFAAALALAGDRAESLRLLERVMALGLGFDPALDPRFASLADSDEFKRIAGRVTAADPPLGRSAVAFTLAERDLIPEGIAYDPKTGATFVGSLAKRKIVRVDRRGVGTDFVATGADGLWAVLGMKVDAKRRRLWACTAAGPSAGTDDGRAGVFVYDLDTGKLVRKALLDTSSGKHLLNDLALAADGAAYATDSLTGAVYRIDPSRDAPEAWIPAGTFIYPNGIALSEDGGTLFVASAGRGVTRIDVRTRAMRDVRPGPRATLAGIDGLSIQGRDLVAVQNALGPGRVVRFRLNGAMDAVERADVLESRHPQFDVPTTGTIAGDRFRFIANSQLPRLQDDGTIKEPATLKETVILDVKL